ncbi:MAG: nitronate monooxygenase [Candidatus Lokiarchaeota archaeon]|nr:nitronate monooxygenase [Candidatus Lokiarchaeota archaeon]
MVLETRLTKELGMKVPIFLSGMGPFSTYKTAVKVSNAGGCGLTSHWGILTPVDPETHYIDRENGVMITPGEKMKFDLEYFEKNLEDDRVFGCNIRVARIQTDAPRVIRQVLKKRLDSRKIRESLKVLVTSAGNPMTAQKILEKDKFYIDGKKDILHFHVSPSLALCQNTLKAGCDGVIAVGYEGGGHQSYEGITTSVLIPETREWIDAECPEKYLIAGGGFFNGRTLASAMALGAEAVQMGTRFIASTDGDFHPNYKEAILKAKDEDTLMCSGAFGPIRLLKNEYALSHSSILSKEEKIKQEKELGTKDDMTQQLMDDMRRYDLVYEGDIEHGAVLVGQTVGGIHTLKSVAQIVSDIEKEAADTIKKLQSAIK